MTHRDAYIVESRLLVNDPLCVSPPSNVPHSDRRGDDRLLSFLFFSFYLLHEQQLSWVERVRE